MDQKQIDVLRHVNRISLLHRLRVQNLLADTGVWGSQIPILLHVERNPGCTQTDIAEHLGVSSPSIATSIKRLQKAGMLENKQNVFDDFIAAAEYLIAGKYTSSERLAINGGSNGGLLIGACEVQRPDLYAVCLPQVGVMDMLRFHKFTIGWGWVVEYGSSEDEEQFSYIYKYSPLHNIKEGVSYPATLVTTGDHDDRVVPAHSFKFAATMQHCQAGDAPILIRIDSNAGHGAGKPTSKRIDEAADMYAFLFQNIGVPYKAVK